MKKLLPQIGLLFLLLLPLLGRAQEVRISGRVVDAATKKPIALASLKLRNEHAEGLTDGKGHFQLMSLARFQQDSLILAAPGFQRYALLIKNGKTEGLVVKMLPLRVGLFTNCLIRPDANKSAVVSSSDGMFDGLAGTQYAFFIKNDKQKRICRIKTVSFYMAENGLPMKSFYLHVYKADGSNMCPTTKLLNEPLLFTAPKGGEWYTFDLSSHNIIAPEKGFFVALEFSPTDHPFSQPCIVGYTASGQVLRPPFDYVNNNLWTCSSQPSWTLLPLSDSSRRYNAMVKVEVNAAQ